MELCTTYVANICKISILYHKNSLFYSRSKICIAFGHVHSPGKVLNDPPALLSRDGSDGFCDGCFEVRDGLGVVLIHPVLEVTPQVEVWGVQVL